MTATATPNEPKLRPVEMHLLRPNEPGTARVVSNEICTASKKSAGYVRHVEVDVTGTPLVGRCAPGQSLGIIPPGEDERGRPHRVRLYSLATPTAGSDGEGAVYGITVKRTIDEHWENHTLFLGVASNYLCDLQEGDEVTVTGPAGKRFVLPEDVNAHEYLFFATGTGIAPYRGMLLELLARGCERAITLIMGAPYRTDLIYDDFFREMAQTHEQFTYLPAISRERHADAGGPYVQDVLVQERDRLMPQLESDQNLIYVCGIAGMELGIFRALARTLDGASLEQYLRIDPEARSSIDAWDRRVIHKGVDPTRRVMLEVYA